MIGLPEYVAFAAPEVCRLIFSLTWKWAFAAPDTSAFSSFIGKFSRFAFDAPVLLRAFDKENAAFAQRVGKDRAVRTYRKYLTVRKSVYMATLGNREDLFPGSGYVDKYTKPPTTYDIPPSV